MNANTQTDPTHTHDFSGTKNEVQAKQATDKPRNMPVVLIVSTVGAAVAMWVIWTVFFA